MLANYQQTKISAPPNLNEPIGFDQLPDGRIIQTARAGQLRLHDPVKGTSKVIATLPVYTNSEDGLYGPAVDNDFATNKWVYLYYAPPTVAHQAVRRHDGRRHDARAAPRRPWRADPCVWTDTWAGYFQLSRFKFVDGGEPDAGPRRPSRRSCRSPTTAARAATSPATSTSTSTTTCGSSRATTRPAGGGNSGGFSPHNDMKTDETQTVRVNDATGGTFTLTFNGQTTAPIAYNATAAADRRRRSRR